ncbi:MAG: hypothetical protein FJZ05_00990 [Candidatus Nealsonbacteria bacterium]|nr:hypothetical protein [Candidatus Nealsonbacteria bacterium]
MSKKKKKMRNNIRLKRHKEEEAKATLKNKIVEMGLWGLGIATTTERQNGLESEQKAIRFLSTIKSNRMKFGSIGVITEVISSEHLDCNDRKGIDITVGFSSGKKMFIDVKNSGSLNLMEYMSDRNRCLLVIPWDISDEEGIKTTIGTIKWWFGLFNR